MQTTKSLYKIIKTGDTIEINPMKNEIILPDRKISVKAKDLGSLLDIINAGGMFAYARQIKKIPL